VLSPEEKTEWRSRRASRTEASSCAGFRLTGEGLDQLLKRMDEALPADPVERLSLRLPLAEGRTLALVHALGQVFHSELDDSHMVLDAEVPVSMARRLKLQDFAFKGTF
jgi:50S ribosomal subunit-associated GTPase HflX